MLKSGQKTAHIVSCLCLFGFALLLRAHGADYGYLNGDERINDAARVLAGNLVPGQHFYPPFFNYVNAVAFVGLFAFGLVTDMWASTGEFRQAYFTDPLPFYLTARYVTAIIAALSAPLFFAVARRSGLSLWGAVFVGLFAALFPLSVFLSHLAKGDTGQAVACLAVMWAFLIRLEAERIRLVDVLIGVCVVLAVSLKQSAALLLAPMAIAMIVILAQRESWGAAFKSFGVALIVAVVLWPILNIGIVLDFQGFLDFQKIQTIMSVKEEDGFGVGLPVTFAQFGRVDFGLNAVMLAIAVVTPVWLRSSSCRLDNKDALLALWIATFASTILTSLLVGERQPEQLFIANLTVLLCLAAIALVDMVRVYAGVPKLVLGVTALAGLGLMAGASANVMRQADAVPATEYVAAFLAEEYPDAKIQTGIALPVPTRMDAQRFEIDRNNRVAAKYGIEMPELAEERLIRENVPGSLYWVDAPFVMSGLEGDDAADADLPPVPFAWPVQTEEWELDTWLDQDFSVFIVSHFAYLRHESRSTAVRNFHAELETRCDLARVFEGRKPLFLEFDLAVFDCTNA